MIKVPSNIEEKLQRASSEHGVPYAILQAVAWVESRFNPSVTSRVGAAGVMQIMPGNWDDLGISDPYDAGQSINGGAIMLAKLYKQFGSWEDALAAYNWGSGNVRKASDRNRWPTSVKTYVAKVLSGAGEPVPFPHLARVRLG